MYCRMTVRPWLDFYRRINVMNVLKEIGDISVSSPSEELDQIQVKEVSFYTGLPLFHSGQSAGEAYIKAHLATDYEFL